MAEAFGQQTTLIPTAIGEVTVTLISPALGSNETARALFHVEVRYSDGSVRPVAGNLVPHLTTAQVNGLLGFMDDMREKAETELLP